MRTPKVKIIVPTFPIALLLGILKLSGALHISWLWVLSPIWLPIVFLLSLAFMLFLWLGLASVVGRFIK